MNSVIRLLSPSFGGGEGFEAIEKKGGKEDWTNYIDSRGQIADYVRVEKNGQG